jgi:hypothetical protein
LLVTSTTCRTHPSALAGKPGHRHPNAIPPVPSRRPEREAVVFSAAWISPQRRRGAVSASDLAAPAYEWPRLVWRLVDAIPRRSGDTPAATKHEVVGPVDDAVRDGPLPRGSGAAAVAVEPASRSWRPGRPAPVVSTALSAEGLRVESVKAHYWRTPGDFAQAVSRLLLGRAAPANRRPGGPAGREFIRRRPGKPWILRSV